MSLSFDCRDLGFGGVSIFGQNQQVLNPGVLESTAMILAQNRNDIVCKMCPHVYRAGVGSYTSYIGIYYMYLVMYMLFVYFLFNY